MLAIIILILIISSIVCILYCNYLSSSYEETDEIKVLLENDDETALEEEHENLAHHAVLEE